MKAPSIAGTADIFLFGPFRLDVARQELRCGGEAVPLTPKAFDTLRMLVEADGAVVPKEELLAAIWRDKFVEESVLSQNVYTLRKVLAEGDLGRTYILTVPRRGYRLTVPVERLADDHGGPTAPPAATAVAATAATAAASSPAATAGGEAASGFPPGPGVPASGRPGAAPVPRPLGEFLGSSLGGWFLPIVTALGVIAVVLAVAARSRVDTPGDGPLRVGSLAVLPFVSLNPAPDGDVLGLAMADALITRFSEMQPLVVRPTSAVQEVRPKARDPIAVGRQLGVDAVMYGSLQRSGERLRVSVRLVRVEDGRPLWARSFATVYTEPFAVQDAISDQVASALSLGLSGRHQHRANRGTADVEAYQEYVRGRYFWNRRTESDLRKAMAHFQRALERDPGFAAAHAGIADCWVLLPLYSNVAPVEAFPRGKEAALAALRLDPDLAEAHTSLAYARLQYDWDWQGSETEFVQAERLDPGYPTAAQWYAYLLSVRGRHDEAIAQARLAQQLDPLSLVINADLGMILYFARHYDAAVGQFERTLELDPRFPYAHFGLALADSAAGRHEAAVAEARQAVELSGGSSVMEGTLGYTLAVAGRTDEARAVRTALEQRARTQRVQAGALALVTTGLGERADAIHWLGAAYRERSRFVVFLGIWPIYDALRDDGRFVTLERQVGLPLPELRPPPATAARR